MSKRRKSFFDQTPEPASELTDPLEVEAVAHTEPVIRESKYDKDLALAEEKGIKHKRWNGIPSYLCPKCAFDSLDIQKIIEHITAAHEPKVTPPKESKIVFADKYGNVQPGPAGSGGSK